MLLTTSQGREITVELRLGPKQIMSNDASISTLVIADEGGVRTIRLNRPTKRNAISREMLVELDRQLGLAKDAQAVRVVRLEGAGGMAFSAGLDLREFTSLAAVDALSFVRCGAELCAAIGRYPKPVVAVIDGYALGGGLELAMACTLRIASDAAVFGLPEVGLGIFPGWRGVSNAVRLLGPTRAAELCLLGDKVDAATALGWGLVNRVLPGHRNG